MSHESREALRKHLETALGGVDQVTAGCKRAVDAYARAESDDAEARLLVQGLQGLAGRLETAALEIQKLAGGLEKDLDARRPS